MADLSKQSLFLQPMFLFFIPCTFSGLPFPASNDVGFAFGEVLQRKCSPATYLRELGNLSWQFWRAVTARMPRIQVPWLRACRRNLE